PPHAAVRDGDFHAVARQDRVARYQLQDAVTAHVLPVGTTGYDLRIEPRSRHPAAKDLDDPPTPMRNETEIPDRPHVHVDVAEIFKLRLHVCLCPLRRGSGSRVAALACAQGP